MKLLKLIFLNLLAIPAIPLIFIGITSPIEYLDRKLDEVDGIEREPRK